MNKFDQENHHQEKDDKQDKLNEEISRSLNKENPSDFGNKLNHQNFIKNNNNLSTQSDSFNSLIGKKLERTRKQKREEREKKKEEETIKKAYFKIIKMKGKSKDIIHYERKDEQLKNLKSRAF